MEGAMAEAGAMTAALSGEIQKMQGAMAATGRDAAVLSKGLSRGLKSAFDGLVFDGMRASDALGAVARSLVNTAYSAAIKPVTNQLGGLLAQGVSGLFANGGAFSQGRVMPFASGGIISGPTAFPMRGGTGVMGEAGPEAIMPLSRGPDGKLGIRSAGGGRPVQVVMNVSTPDAASFQRSQSQIAAQMSRALSRSQRNQ
ncbi:MAG: phage tail tape measure protein [Silicimonas sp.]|nr:phage tail tape measure protein [Silicimonas sp.]